ncbi:MAG: HlyD family efflux transporter periplasmic adaptor subunit [Chloroflexi bacterium]|nr:HlyD family efflux transporter periplasmic adaptor subunit [Chloroflexota bacterium]
MPGVALRRRSYLAVGGLSLLVMSVACTGPGPASRQAPPPAAEVVAVASPTPVPPTGFQVGAVRVGPITESVALTGRVADRSETPITAPVAVRIASYLVELGKPVTEGQQLAEVDATGAERELSDTRARKEAADARLERARGVLNARRQRADEDLTRMTAPPAQSEQLQAAGAVATARENLRKAEADVARLNSPAASADAKVAEQAVLSAQSMLKKAETDLARLKKGADPSDLRRAQNDVATAESNLAKAVEAHRVLTAGPEPFALRAAERAVMDAEQQLRTAESIKPLPIVYSRTNDGKTDREARRRAEQEAENARVARDADIKKAELGLKNAIDQLNKVRQPPPASEVQSAVRAVESGERSLTDAKEKLALVQAGPKPEEIEAAEIAVTSAQATLDRAVINLETARSGPSESDAASARASLVSARSNLEVAVARQNELMAGKNPDSTEVRAAQDRIALLDKLAESSLEAIDEQASSIDPKDKEMLDAVGLYRDALKAAADEQARLTQAEQAVQATRLVAPSAGVVTAIVTQPGEQTQPGKPVLFLAKPGEPIVKADIPARDGGRIANGQAAKVELAEQPGTIYDATVVDVADSESGRRVTLQAVWGGNPPAYGQVIQSTVVVQEKPAALLVPRRAVTSVGSRRYVDIFDRTPPRRVAVEVGLSNADEVEVTGDIREGQPVLVAP